MILLVRTVATSGKIKNTKATVTTLVPHPSFRKRRPFWQVTDDSILDSIRFDSPDKCDATDSKQIWSL